jgi:N-acyl-D-amino-acid deacylase
MQKKGMAVNHATLVGLGTVRRYIMGNERRKPTSQEMDAMKKTLSEAMIQGAFGMSDGLENAPDRFFRTEEIAELLRIVAQHRGFYATHMRSEDIYLLEAVAEAIHISQTAKIPLHISHLKAVGRSNYYKVPLIIDLIERAKKRGLEVTADRYPYTAWNTSINIMFPMWAVAGGQNKFVERLKDSDLRKKMKEETLEKVEGSNSWESIVVQAVNNEKNRHLIGKNLREAAKKKNQDPYDFVCDLLISEGGSLSVIGFGMSEENTALILKHPLVMLCSDGRALAPYGILSENVPHPRNYGAFPRFLKVYVREKKLLPLSEAIKKMTSMPAKRMELKKRGAIKKGNYADIVVFDASKIADKATYIQPKQYPEGIDYVLVNGQVVIEKGKHTGSLPGKVLHGPGKN